jgi:hypothetical protein
MSSPVVCEGENDLYAIFSRCFNNIVEAFEPLWAIVKHPVSGIPNLKACRSNEN